MVIIPPSLYAAAAKRAADEKNGGTNAEPPADATASKAEPSEQLAMTLAALASAAGVALLVALLTLPLWSRSAGAQSSAPPATQAPQAAPTQSAFVIARGADTIAVERVTRGYAKRKDGRIGADVMGPLADWIALKLSAPHPQP